MVSQSEVIDSLRTYKLALLRISLHNFIADLSSDSCMLMVTVGFNFDFVLYRECFTPSRTTFDSPDMLSTCTTPGSTQNGVNSI